MNIKESIEQLNSLIEHFENGGLDFNVTDVAAIKCLLNNRQELMVFIKEKISLCNKYIKIHKEELAGIVNVSETNRHLMLIKNLTIKKEVYEEILSKLVEIDQIETR